MSMRYQAGVLTASYFPLKVPNAPTIGTASSASATSVAVTFTAPSDVGGGAITGYSAVAIDSSSGATFSGTGSSSPVTVSGLTLGNTYTVKVAATNAFGTGPQSAASNSVTTVAQGQQAFTTAGTFSWIAPAGVSSISVVAVGGGGSGCLYLSNYNTGGGGGGLGYTNNYSVTAGNSYTVQVGAGGLPGGNSNPPVSNGGDSYFVSTGVVKGGGGISANPNNAAGGTYTGNSNNGLNPAGTGAGGGGGGGVQFGGGGVGILGQGSNGAGASGNADVGGGGSGGSNGNSGLGGTYGGGAGYNSTGGVGAVRIIWPGTTRSFPSTNTGDL